MPAPERSTRSRAPRPLADSLITLADTPDDASGIDTHLERIVQLAADRVAAVAYASVTALRGEEFTTVAASSDLALAVDEAQYADGTGPCLDALDRGEPVTVPRIATTMRWPGFVAAASRMGLDASVSIPLFTGSGAAVAVLNLYGHDERTMAPLIVAVWSVYDPAKEMPSDSHTLPPLDPGGEELVEGFAEALTVRATIQLALDVITARHRYGAHDAYLLLRARAAASGLSLTQYATAVITGDA